MPYTDDIEGARRWTKGPTGNLQIVSFKVAAIAKELRWPLEVYGLIAIRDYVDRKRNIIFARARDNCQTITPKVCTHCFSMLIALDVCECCFRLHMLNFMCFRLHMSLFTIHCTLCNQKKTLLP
jgi:hypothetical protein